LISPSSSTSPSSFLSIDGFSLQDKTNLAGEPPPSGGGGEASLDEATDNTDNSVAAGKGDNKGGEETPTPPPAPMGEACLAVPNPGGDRKAESPQGLEGKARMERLWREMGHESGTASSRDVDIPPLSPPPSDRLDLVSSSPYDDPSSHLQTSDRLLSPPERPRETNEELDALIRQQVGHHQRSFSRPPSTLCGA